MKRYLEALCVCCLLLVCSCSPDVKTCSGRINRLNDTLMVMQIGDYTIDFDIRKARYTNGAILSGDSVNVDYTGDLRQKKAKALTVSLIPPVGTVVDLSEMDTTKELLVAPKSPEQVKALREFVEGEKNR